MLPCGGDPRRPDPAAVAWHRRPVGGSTEPAVGAGFTQRGDGSLWLERLRPDHEGRFTCTDTATDQLIAVYDLKVRSSSAHGWRIVETPGGGFRQVTIHCRAERQIVGLIYPHLNLNHHNCVEF